MRIDMVRAVQHSNIVAIYQPHARQMSLAANYTDSTVQLASTVTLRAASFTFA